MISLKTLLTCDNITKEVDNSMNTTIKLIFDIIDIMILLYYHTLYCVLSFFYNILLSFTHFFLFIYFKLDICALCNLDLGQTEISEYSLTNTVPTVQTFNDSK